MIVLGCDPGTNASALVAWDGERILSVLHMPNEDLRAVFHQPEFRQVGSVLACEWIESYGMAVGQEVFKTVFWSGRFAEAFAPYRFEPVPRRVVKQHLCHTARATDSNIRQALIDRFGGQDRAIGKKASQGPLYGLKGHTWAAFAVAVTFHDQHASLPETIRPGVTPEF